MKNSKQLYFEMPNKTSLGVEDYIVTDSNNFAFDLIVKMVRGEINFGLISGPPYSGKTHLSKILIKNSSNYKSFYIDRDYQNILDRFETSDILIARAKRDKILAELDSIEAMSTNNEDQINANEDIEMPNNEIEASNNLNKENINIKSNEKISLLEEYLDM